jgi:transposase InsO family protein
MSCRHYREAGIVLKEMVIDGGPEFKGEFRKTCAPTRVSVHQIPPRSPDLDAFVERFQGTVLHLQYRTAFRYRFYGSATDVDADLAGWLRFYNFERPHPRLPDQGTPTCGDLLRRTAPALLIMKAWDIDEPTPQSVRP